MEKSAALIFYERNKKYASENYRVRYQFPDAQLALRLDILKDTRKYKFYNPLRELEIAENHFNFCEQEHMSAAIFELCSAESRVERLTGGVIQ